MIQHSLSHDDFSEWWWRYKNTKKISRQNFTKQQHYNGKQTTNNIGIKMQHIRSNE